MKKTIKEIINDVFAVLMGIEFCLTFGYIIYTRFANIDMTETRLFLTYWKQYLFFAVFWIIFALIFEATKEKKE